MKQFKSKRLLFAGTLVLLVVVGLLSFGERARRKGHYHFDGGRGWDFAPAASLDAGHVSLHIAILSPADISIDREETLVHIPVLPQAIPAPRSVALGAWQRLRPPPHA